MIGAHELCVVADLTYRQVDYWTRTGHLNPTGDRFPGSGNTPRLYDHHQVALAIQLSRLTKAGIPMPRAAHVARELLDTGRCDLSPHYVLAPVHEASLTAPPLPTNVHPITTSTGDTAA
ncbi:MerR family transcriptional regulator [Nocardioides sp. SOB77]|uniref:MerR family transcriptional regulator n=1 Tax=Nocardioides oceani TaxID=3058369 RepID=A0ABT8FHL2_9ACTN|nr:MerR family transcriptional regulator [Nocardioides oceani]MDN4173945.1 MerR family transcriptional regulator [Nocardioides oceani]